MNCSYDRELLALYVNGDLSGEELCVTQTHLLNCSGCRSVVAQYRESAGALAVALAAVPIPGSLRLGVRPRRVTGRSVAAAAVILALLIVASGPALAEQVGQMMRRLVVGAHVVREITLEDALEVGRSWPRLEEDLTPPVVTVAAAEQELGYRLPQPGYLPDGFQLQEVRLVPAGPSGPRYAVLNYTGPQRGWLSIYELTGPYKGDFPVPEGNLREVKVAGNDAIVIEGGWLWLPEDPQVAWDRGIEITIVFVWQDRTLAISASPGVTDADLIQIAESVP